MKPYQKRVVAEKARLDERREALSSFIGSRVCRKKVGAKALSQLNRQLAAMTLCSNILGERIADFAP